MNTLYKSGLADSSQAHYFVKVANRLLAAVIY